VNARLHEAIVPLEAFLADVRARHVARVPGTAVFLTRTKVGAPPVMVWHVRHNRALHCDLVAVNVTTASVPFVTDGSRLSVELEAPRFWRVIARYGFMERPDIPALLEPPAHKEIIEGAQTGTISGTIPMNRHK